MEHFDKNKDFFSRDFSKGLVLTQDENIHILTYIMIQSQVPDLNSQIELITAFTSDYMQEGPDGCLISQTYLQLIACFRWIESMDLSRMTQDDNDSYVDLAELNSMNSSIVKSDACSFTKE